MKFDQMSRRRVEDLIQEEVLAVGDGYRAKRSELSSEGLPFVRAGNIDRGFDFEDAELLGWTGVQKAGEKAAQPGDVVFTSKGTVGRFAFVWEDTSPFVYSPQLSYWRSLAPKVLAPEYLYYWMLSPSFEEQVRAVKGETDMADYVSLRDQRRMFLSFPTLEVQHGIASVLGAIDAKIKLNRKMNRTLEEIAQTLFRAWFVDSEGGTGLVRSALEASPSGREEVPVGDCIELAYGKSLPKRLRESGTIEVYGSGGRVGSHNVVLIDGPGVIVGRKGTVGSVYWSDSDFWPIDTTFHVKVLDDRLSLLWTYFRLRNMNLQKLASDSAVPGINRNAVYSRVWAIPSSSEPVEEFDKIVTPIMERARVNRDQSRTLAELRDTLLPKLISGEIRVPEAADLAEDAGASPS